MKRAPLPERDRRFRNVREDFPILRQRVHGKPLVYLDNASTTQKPRVVIDRVARYYTEENANIHRGVHRSASTRRTPMNAHVRCVRRLPERG